MNTLGHDIRFAIRHIVARPGVPVLAVLSLAIAQGVNIGLFSIVNSIWFAPWPVAVASHIRVIEPAIPESVCAQLASRLQSFSQLACVTSGPFLQLNGRSVAADFVSSNYFEVIGAAPAFGAGFEASDDAPYGSPKAVISDRLWRIHYSSDPDIVGKTLSLAPAHFGPPAVSFTVAGVAPPGFEGAGGLRKQLWLPLTAVDRFGTDAPLRKSSIQMVTAFGRLSSDSNSVLAATEVAKAIGNLLAENHLPEVQRGPIRVTATDLYSRYSMSRETRLAVASLVIGVTVVTFIGCANILNLLLARGHSRRSEIAVRLAVGASRWQVVRLLLVESLVIAMIGSILGLIIAMWLPGVTLRALLNSTTPELADLVRSNFPLDRRVYLWTFVMSIAASACFGTWPALRSSKTRPLDMLKETNATSSHGYISSFLGLQTIVSVMAITLGGLILRSDSALDAQAWRSTTAGLSVVRPDLPHNVDDVARALLTRTIEDRLVILAGRANVGGVGVRTQTGSVEVVPVTPEYFAILRMRIVSGRPFVASDLEEEVMVVNDAFSRRFPLFGEPTNGNARIAPTSPGQPLEERRVVGIVEDEESKAVAYLPLLSTPGSTFIVRAPYAQLLLDVPAYLSRLESSAAVHISRASEADGAPSGSSLLVAYMVIAFGALFLVLGAIGFCGLLDYSIRQRTREVGIRVAIGATQFDIVRAIVTPTWRIVLRSLIMGEVAGMALGIVLERSDVADGVKPLDPSVYAAVTFAMLIIGISAAYQPIRRAIGIPVTDALRD